jgi:hypothetical protein
MVPRGKIRRVILEKAGSDFIGETFRVLKEKEEKQYGEYRTRRLVLEAWDGLQMVHTEDTSHILLEGTKGFLQKMQKCDIITPKIDLGVIDENI